MGLLDKVKAGAQEVATKTREEVHELQTKRELAQTYADLGKKVFELADRGEISHAELDDFVQRIRALRAELETK